VPDLAFLFALAALICAAAGLIIAVVIYRRPPPWLKGLTGEFKGSITPHLLGEAIRHALTAGVTDENGETPTVPRVINAMLAEQIEFQKPNLMKLMEHELIPLLGVIGGGQVAEDARLARAAKKLPGGASGIQGVMGLLTAPSKKSGLGDLMQYLPLVQQFLGAQQGKNDGNTPHNSPQMQSGGGRIGGT